MPPGRRASSPRGGRPGLSVLQPPPLRESLLSLPTPGPSGPQGNPGSFRGLPGSASQGPGARTGLQEVDFCSSASQDGRREGGLAEREGRLWSFRIAPNCVKEAEQWACAHQAVEASPAWGKAWPWTRKLPLARGSSWGGTEPWPLSRSLGEGVSVPKGEDLGGVPPSVSP